MVVVVCFGPASAECPAARAVLDMLLSARARQTGKDQQAGPGELVERRMAFSRKLRLPYHAPG